MIASTTAETAQADGRYGECYRAGLCMATLMTVATELQALYRFGSTVHVEIKASHSAAYTTSIAATITLRCCCCPHKRTPRPPYHPEIVQ